MIAFSEETCGVERSQPLVISPPLSHPSRVSLGQWMTNLGLYLVFIKFRLLPFNLLAQILVGAVGFIGLLVVLFGMNYTQPFSIGTTVSGLVTQIEARVPGKVIEVDVRDDSFVRKGEVLFRMDPQPYVDQLHHAQSAYAEAEIRTSTAILRTTQSVNSASAQVQAVEAQIQATQAAIGATESQLNLAKTRLKGYTELKSKNAGSLFEVERYETDVKSLTDQVAAQNQQVAAQEQQLAAAQAQLVQAQTAHQEAVRIQPDVLESGGQGECRHQAPQARIGCWRRWRIVTVLRLRGEEASLYNPGGERLAAAHHLHSGTVDQHRRQSRSGGNRMSEELQRSPDGSRCRRGAQKQSRPSGGCNPGSGRRQCGDRSTCLDDAYSERRRRSQVPRPLPSE